MCLKICYNTLINKLFVRKRKNINKIIISQVGHMTGKSILGTVNTKVGRNQRESLNLVSLIINYCD